MSVTIYVEGGGDRKDKLESKCRRGFRAFLERAGLEGNSFSIVVCGGRGEAYKRFRSEVRDALLLVDSEDLVEADPWQHVAQRPGDKWKKPDGAAEGQLHFMAQAMEAWFHCDPEALQRYYGSCFRVHALSARPAVEEIPKTDLFDGLKAATKHCKKGTYAKGGHSFEILALVDPEKVRKRAPHAEGCVKDFV